MATAVEKLGIDDVTTANRNGMSGGAAELEGALAFIGAATSPGGRRSASAYVLRHPRAAWRAASVLHRLPTLSVRVSDAPAGAHIRSLIERRTFGITRPRYAMSVLPVAPLDEYLRGRSRTAVRNNCTNARRLGVTCREVSEVEDQLAATKQILTQRGELDNWDTLRALVASRRDLVFVAEAGGAPVGIAFVTVDGEVANLGWCLSVPGDARNSTARYLLHVHVIDALSERLVTLLFADALVVVSDGLRYFQHRLGFGVANLRVRASS